MHSRLILKQKVILAGFLAIVSLSAYCFISGEELYPFAPFKMYSTLYFKDCHYYRLEGVLAAGNQSVVVENIGSYSENRIVVMMQRFSSKKSELQVSANVVLTNLINDCRIQKQCEIRVNGEIHRAGEFKSFRVVNRYYKRLHLENFENPDKIEVLAESIL